MCGQSCLIRFWKFWVLINKTKVLPMVTLLFYLIFILFDESVFFLDCSSRISLQTLFENVESLLHFRNLKNICDTSVVESLARSLVE